MPNALLDKLKWHTSKGLTQHELVGWSLHSRMQNVVLELHSHPHRVALSCVYGNETWTLEDLINVLVDEGGLS